MVEINVVKSRRKYGCGLRWCSVSLARTWDGLRGWWSLGFGVSVVWRLPSVDLRFSSIARAGKCGCTINSVVVHGG